MNILTTLFHNAHHQSAGKFHSIRSERPHPFLPGEKMGADVSLSINAMRLVEIFKDEATSEETLAATGYDKFALNFYLQLEEKGKQADILKEVPKSSDPARIALSQQATNYFLTALYGEESLHIGVSEENPFAQIDRLTLSNMAFDESGTFTSVERQVAFLEIAKRDSDFRDQTYNYQNSWEDENDTVDRSGVILALRDAQLASAMSEAERAWRGWPAADELYAQANSLLKQLDMETPVLPAYANLKGQEDSVLAVVTNDMGLQPAWKNIPIKNLDPKGTNISLIQAVVIDPVTNKPEFKAVNSKVGEWLSIYMSISNLKST